MIQRIEKYLVTQMVFSQNACENIPLHNEIPYKPKLGNTECNLVRGHVPKTEYFKGSFSYGGGIL